MVCINLGSLSGSAAVIINCEIPSSEWGFIWCQRLETCQMYWDVPYVSCTSPPSRVTGILLNSELRNIVRFLYSLQTNHVVRGYLRELTCIVTVIFFHFMRSCRPHINFSCMSFLQYPSHLISISHYRLIAFNNVLTNVNRVNLVQLFMHDCGSIQSIVHSAQIFSHLWVKMTFTITIYGIGVMAMP